MRINGKKLTRLAQKRGVSTDQLARAIARDDKPKQIAAAETKVRNWMEGRNHPAVKPAEISAIAGVIGATVPEIASFTSMCKWSRSSPRKARLVVDLIRGKRVDEASALLKFSPKRASVFIGKALNAAIADAASADANIDSLIVSEARVDGGLIIKRFQPKDRGRAHPIRKRTSHIVIGVEEAN